MKVLFFCKNQESLAIEYLSAFLKLHGHQTDLLFDPAGDNLGFRFFDMFASFTKQIIDEKITHFHPNLIAFSVFTDIYEWCSEIAQYIKTKYNIPVIMGGSHPTIVPDLVIANNAVDYICIGEGENCFLQLCNALEKHKDLASVPNLWHKKDATINKNRFDATYFDFNTLPIPDKDLFFKFGAFKDQYYAMTYRGCPNNCTYCMNHQIHELYVGQNPIRQRSVENVINELIWAKKRYKIKKIYFLDDNFIQNEKWLCDFAAAYQKKQINLPFKCLIHPNSVTPKKANLLRQLECKDVDLGVESGSSIIREQVMHRYITDKQILYAAKVLKSYGIRVTTLNIINNPRETYQDMIKTFVINKRIHPSGMLITNLTPYPNTKIFKICVEDGLINKETMLQILDGQVSIHNPSVITHPLKELGERIRLFAPIFIHLPNFLSKYLFYFPSIR